MAPELPPSKPPTDEDGENRAPQGVYAMFSVGLQLAGTVVVFALLGWWLDERWSTSPAMLLTGLGIGLGGGLYSFIKSASKR